MLMGVRQVISEANQRAPVKEAVTNVSSRKGLPIF